MPTSDIATMPRPMPGSAMATMPRPMPGSDIASGMASMDIDAPGSVARGSLDTWAGYVPTSAQDSGIAQASGSQGSGQANASSLGHWQQSAPQASALHEALDNAQQHVDSVAHELQLLMQHKESRCVVYVCVALCAHTLQCH